MTLGVIVCPNGEHIYFILCSKILSCSVYADDTLLYVSGPTVNVVESKLSEDMERIITWLINGNYLFLNYEKTKVMLVGTQQRCVKSQTSLSE